MGELCIILNCLRSVCQNLIVTLYIQTWTGLCLCFQMERRNSSPQGHGTSSAFPWNLIEQLLKVTLLLGCWTLGSGLSLIVSVMKALVHHHPNGRALVNPHPISLATSKLILRFSFSVHDFSVDHAPKVLHGLN